MCILLYYWANKMIMMTSNSQAREQAPRPKEKNAREYNTELLKSRRHGNIPAGYRNYKSYTDVTPTILSRDFVARVRDFISCDCRELQSLRLCRVNKHGFCTTFPVSRSAFTSTSTIQDDEIVPYLVFSKLLDWSVRFHFARKSTKTKLLLRFSVVVSVR